MASSPSFVNGEKKQPWWLSNRKIVDKYVKEARGLVSSRDHDDVALAVTILDSALVLSPRCEFALELKAKSLLYLRRYKEVAEMLQEYIPSLKIASEDCFSSGSSVSSDASWSKERVKLLPSSINWNADEQDHDHHSYIKCFSVSDLKKKVMERLSGSGEKEGQWRYLVLGQACCHLGLMEDAMVLLQTGKRIATAALRRESICWSDDSFSTNSHIPTISEKSSPTTDSESISQLLSHIKLLLRRKTAALAALDAGLHSEAIRHFSKIVESRRGAPQGFQAECYMHRAIAYKSAGRIVESISDCNRTLALDPSCIQALTTRAALLEIIRCLPECLHDLEHLKLLYNSILRDRRLQGPVWKRHNVRYREIPGRLCSLNVKIQELKQRVGSGETGNVDYYALIGLNRGCSRSELERAHLLLCLKHKPDKATSFIERCEFGDDCDLDSVRDRAKMSALLLYRLLQKGYTSVMRTIIEEEVAEKERKKAQAALQATAIQIQKQTQDLSSERTEDLGETLINPSENNSKPSSSPVYQGVFCRDISVVGNLLSQVGFNLPLPVKYEALSC